MTTKKRFILTALFLFSFLTIGVSSANIADPTPFNLTQPNGYTFLARYIGDENRAHFETMDRYIILENKEWWVYAKLENGTLVPSEERVGGARTSIKKVKGSELPKVKSKTELKRGKIKKLSTLSPSKPPEITGTQKIVVIAIDFSDKSGTKSISDFNDLLFSGKKGSLNHYYYEVSYGQLNLTGEISDWYRSDHPHYYYGADINEIDDRISELAREAIRKADKDIDFSEYDNNRDGFVDHIIIIYAGDPQSSTGKSTDIWPHFGYIQNGEEVDGVTADTYSMVAESSGMGTYAHEFFHSLGAPDLYDTNYDGTPVGVWCLMASGSYLNNSATPAHICGYLKYDVDGDPKNGYNGWLTPTIIQYKSESKSISIDNLESDTGNRLYRINTADPKQYFLIENRQKIGYDEYLPDSGILIWHIDENMPDMPDYEPINDGLPFNSFYRAWVENPGNQYYKHDAAYSLEDLQTVFNDTSNPDSSLNGNDTRSAEVSINNIGPSREAKRSVDLAEGNGWGAKATSATMTLDVKYIKPKKPNYIIESPHPYPNNYSNTWIIKEPSANKIRIHFNRVDTEDCSAYGDICDILEILDGNDNLIIEYSGNYEDFFSPWVDGDTIKVRLITDPHVIAYGFSVDKKESIKPLSVSITSPLNNTIINQSDIITFNSYVSGGMTPYTYTWNMDNTIIGSSQTFTYSPPVGNHTIFLTVKDANGAIASDLINIIVKSNILGDFNKNGRVDIGDATLVAYMVVGKVPADPSADFNNNGRVDIGDATKIAYYLVGKIDSLI